MGVLKLAKADLIRTIKNPKTLIIILLGFFFLSSNTTMMRDIATESGLGVPPFVYPVFLSEWRGRMYALVLMVVLMSEAPFYNGSEIFTMMRIDRYKWLTSKFIYMFFISVLFQVAMIIMSVLVFGSSIGFGAEWGDVIHMYMNSMQGMISAEGIIDTGGILSLSPITVMVYELVLMVLLSLIIGMATFVLNGVIKSIAGTVMVGILVLSDIYLTDLSIHGVLDMTYILPTTWVDINCFFAGEGLTFEKCAIYMLIIIAALVTLSYMLVAKRVIKPVRNV